MANIMTDKELYDFARHFQVMQEEVHLVAIDHGFWDDRNNMTSMGIEAKVVDRYVVPTKIALIHSELSEALEGFRKDPDNNNLGEELADTIIRIMDLAEFWSINLGDEIVKKNATNLGRSYMHGKEF